MNSILLKSKLHRATVTDANVEYEGSITIDADLMDIAKIVPYEKVLVANVDNANRFETYVLEGKRGSGTICVNGAAAHLCKVGDRVIIISFCLVESEELSAHRPVVVLLDENNKPKSDI